MSKLPLVPLEEIMTSRNGSVDPSNFPDEVFDLYSIPTYDRGEPEVAAGSTIGSSKQIVQSGDVLLSRIVPHIRRAWIVGENRGRRLIASGEWIVFRSPRFHPAYLRHALMADAFHSQFMNTVAGVGGSLLRARPTHVAKILIPLPSLAEQRRIADILDKADGIRRKRREGSRLTEQLLPSAFLEMFGDFGANPKGWEVVSLGGITRLVTSGLTPTGGSSVYLDDGPLFIRSQNVLMNRLDLSDAACLPESIHEAMNRTKVHDGDVLLNITGASIGRVTWVAGLSREANVNQHVCIIRLDRDRATPEFVSVFLSLPFGQRQIGNMETGASRQGLNHEQVRSLKVPLPPLPDQKRFSRFVQMLLKNRAEHECALRESETLFQALVQRAFRGEL